MHQYWGKSLKLDYCTVIFCVVNQSFLPTAFKPSSVWMEDGGFSIGKELQFLNTTPEWIDSLNPLMAQKPKSLHIKFPAIVNLVAIEISG